MMLQIKKSLLIWLALIFLLFKSVSYANQIDAISLISSGHHAYEGGEYSLAISYYSKALKLDPKNAYIRMKRGLATFNKAIVWKSYADFIKDFPQNDKNLTILIEETVDLPDNKIKDKKLLHLKQLYMTHTIAREDIEKALDMEECYNLNNLDKKKCKATLYFQNFLKKNKFWSRISNLSFGPPP